jgi:hypothetical protein
MLVKQEVDAEQFLRLAPFVVTETACIQANPRLIVTGDTKYLDRAALAIDSLNKYMLQSSGGYAGLGDVNNVTAGYWDVQESFWFAEVLKYLCVGRIFFQFSLSLNHTTHEVPHVRRAQPQQPG